MLSVLHTASWIIVLASAWSFIQNDIESASAGRWMLLATRMRPSEETAVGKDFRLVGVSWLDAGVTTTFKLKPSTLISNDSCELSTRWTFRQPEGRKKHARLNIRLFHNTVHKKIKIWFKTTASLAPPPLRRPVNPVFNFRPVRLVLRQFHDHWLCRKVEYVTSSYHSFILSKSVLRPFSCRSYVHRRLF